VTFGQIKDGRRVNSLYEVSHDRMHTLIIAELWEHDLIKQDLEGFWKKVRGKMHPHFVLVFDSELQIQLRSCVFSNSESNGPFTALRQISLYLFFTSIQRYF
jgi:hypothetical protein